MRILDLARRLLSVSALLVIGGLAVSVLTHDAWLIVGHAAGALSGVIALIAVALLLTAGYRRLKAKGKTRGQAAPAPPCEP